MSTETESCHQTACLASLACPEILAVRGIQGDYKVRLQKC